MSGSKPCLFGLSGYDACSEVADKLFGSQTSKRGSLAVYLLALSWLLGCHFFW